MNTKVIVGVMALIVVGVGAYGYSNNKKEAMLMEQKASDEKMMMEKKTMEEKAMMEQEKMGDKAAMENKDGAMMEQKDGQMMNKDGAMMTKGGYEAYSPEKLAWADSGKVVLFFRATWCPTCKALDADIKAHMASIPDGVHILDVDYDNSADLKQKYGVTMQHTLVQVDSKGALITKWSGGGTLDSVVKNLK
jgi:thioredoxin 1